MQGETTENPPDWTSSLSKYQYWHGVPTMLGCEHDPTMSDAEVGLIGIPVCSGNSIDRGQYLAPRAVRTMSTAHHRANRALRFDPFTACRIRDLGDVPVSRALESDGAVEEIAEYFEAVAAKNIRPVSVGGDHSVLIGILRGLVGPGRPIEGPISLVHFDAHTDYYPMPGAEESVHGAAFHLLTRSGLVDPQRMVQIGIRGPVADLDQDEFAKADGVRVIEQVEVDEIGPDAVIDEIRRFVGDGPTYLTFDMDALDPIYAPAVTDPEAEGMTVKDALRIVRGLRGLDLIGGDVVEFGPPFDVRGGPGGGGLTTYHATTMFYEIVCLVADSLQSRRSG